MLKSHNPIKVQIIEQPTLYNLIIKKMASDQQEEITTNDFVRKVDEGFFELDEEEQVEMAEEHGYEMAI